VNLHQIFKCKIFRVSYENSSVICPYYKSTPVLTDWNLVQGGVMGVVKLNLMHSPSLLGDAIVHSL
jgi:hypothetical protein